MREKSTNGNTITPYDVNPLRERIASARKMIADASTEFDAIEESVRGLETAHAPLPALEDEPSTAQALEQAGAAPSLVDIARAVKEMLVADGVVPNRNVPRARKPTSTERPSSALESWMLAENTRQDMTRWLGLMIDGTAQAFRLFRKHLPKGKPGEKAAWLIRNLAGEAWRLVPVDTDPPFGPGRPLKLVAAGNVTINGLRYTWREAPNSRTCLGVLHNADKDRRYAVVRDTSLDMSPDKIIPADVRGAV